MSSSYLAAADELSCNHQPFLPPVVGILILKIKCVFVHLFLLNYILSGWGLPRLQFLI